jgi:hypothetical protein
MRSVQELGNPEAPPRGFPQAATGSAGHLHPDAIGGVCPVMNPGDTRHISAWMKPGFDAAAPLIADAYISAYGPNNLL